ncbi:MAG TPA: type II CRISPR RNA-guided endonuclease Cas9, partial [Chitinophagales bacterium]|nr:type II CRISPR RNA-guided endonuclease Cas9 [Chitinophagales bacterium]
IEIIKLDFSKGGFSNKSSRAVRKILPYLRKGLGYSNACKMAGYNHSNSFTKSENVARRLLEKLPLLKKNTLRQPIVETILNQMINVVNAIGEKYGKPDEIRVELARELKQSREERNKATKNINTRKKENKNIESILSELSLKTNRRSIEKYRLYKEINNEESKLNATCIYCNQALSFASSINGMGVEVEHIIPRSRLFDDSFQNKTLVHTHCNLEKGNMTAFDFMQSKSEKEFNDYLDRVEMLFKNKIISKAKRDKLLTSADKIPTDFIARQLRETQYVASKAREILMQYCHHVYATSGGVTDYLRHQWGWNDVLMNLQLERYRTVGQTELIDVSENDVIKKKEIIKNWTKRNDHRHHAIDALTVACTSQGIIQRLNTLNKFVQKLENESKQDALKSVETLKTFVQNERPFTTREVETEVDKILVSFKAGKKVATKGRRLIKKGGKNIIAQSDIIVPRGALSEESIYGKIKLIERNVPLRKLFDNPDAILKRYIKAKVNDRLKEYNNDSKKAFSSTKKDPIYLVKDNTVALEYASIFKEEFVIKYKVDINLNANKVDKIVDEKVRTVVQERLNSFGGKEKEAFKDLINNPIWLNEEKGIQVKSVRCKTGLSDLQPLHYSNNGLTGTEKKFDADKDILKEIDFVKPGNNHHVSIFKDENGQLYDIVTTFWEAVERKKEGLPIINKNHPDGYEFLYSLQQNEMFVFNPEKTEVQASVNEISKRLYRVQKISKKSDGSLDVWFRHHLETELIDNINSKSSMRYINTRSTQKLQNLTKIRVDNLGQII